MKMRVEDWTAIWYKCLACQRCFQFPDRLIAHKNLTECGNVYKNKFSYLLDSTSDDNNNISGANSLQNRLPLSSINKPLIIKIEKPEELKEAEGNSGNKSFSEETNNSADPYNQLHSSNQTKENKNLWRKTKGQDLKISKRTTENTTVRKGRFTKHKNCYFCNKTLINYHSLEVHLGIHTKEMPFSCIGCGQRFLYKYKLKTHICKIHKTQPLKIVKRRRIQSSKQFVHRRISIISNLRSFNKRRLAVHGRVKFLKCKDCGKQFHYPSELKRHQLGHSECKPVECKECGKRFKHSRNFNRHLLIHTGVKSFKCKECGKLFAYSWTLKAHLLTHAKVNVFKCKECGNPFTQKAHLKIHLLTHTGVKVFECKECGNPFTQKAHLKRHMLTHTGVKAFECKECGKRFAYSWVLKSHLLTHFGVKPFECTECGKRYSQSGHLKTHMLLHE